MARLLTLPLGLQADSLCRIALAHSASVTYHSFDNTSAASVSGTISLIARKVRPEHPLRGLVACAGISGRYPAVDYPIDEFRQILDVNITGTFLCAREVARAMREQRLDGSIVLVASMSGHAVNQVSQFLD